MKGSAPLPYGCPAAEPLFSLLSCLYNSYDMREMLLRADELALLDGKGGRRALFAYDGRLYDVSGSFLWKGGRHQALHVAGRDLSGLLSTAPHGEDLLQRVPVVGRLIGETQSSSKAP
jgi:predicted heme/steroid binding protein